MVDILEFFMGATKDSDYAFRTYGLLKDKSASFLKKHNVTAMFQKKDFLYGIRKLAQAVSQEYPMKWQQSHLQAMTDLELLNQLTTNENSNCRLSSAITAQVIKEIGIAKNPYIVIVPRPYQYYHSGVLTKDGDTNWLVEYAAKGARVNRISDDFANRLDKFPVTEKGILQFDKSLRDQVVY